MSLLPPFSLSFSSVIPSLIPSAVAPYLSPHVGSHDGPCPDGLRKYEYVPHVTSTAAATRLLCPSLHPLDTSSTAIPSIPSTPSDPFVEDPIRMAHAADRQTHRTLRPLRCVSPH